MTVTQFRGAYGEKWAELVASPMWEAALALCDSLTKTLDVAGLTTEEIKGDAAVILARQQGYLEHVRLMARLHAMKDFDFKAIVEDYPDPLKEFSESQKTTE